MTNFIKNIWAKFIKVLYPEYGCFICGRENEHPENYICPRCEQVVYRLKGTLCEKCGAPVPGIAKLCLNCKNNNELYFTKARAVFAYDENTSKPVMGLKYNGKKYLVPFMAKEMKAVLKEFKEKPDIIIPVPTTAKRLKKRGFNQAELLAYELSEQCGKEMEVQTKLIYRSKEVHTQVNLTRKQRLENLKGAFKLTNNKSLEGKVVLIVDDVFTTGATSNEVARVLSRLKPKAIYVLTFAKTLFDEDNLN